MSVNKYFDPYNDHGQQELYRELINEVVQQYGFDCVYVPRSSQSNVDLFFGDDPTKSFANGYTIEVYVENTEQFSGGDLFMKVPGLVIMKTVNVLMGNDAFNIATAGELGPRPREGDLVWLKPFQALYEIKFVNQDKFFYAFGNRKFYGFSLECEEFRYNNEVVASGFEDVDEKIAGVMAAYLAQMANTGTGTFTLTESVYQGSSYTLATATAQVVDWDITTQQLTLGQMIGEFLPNVAIVGVESGASWNLASINVLDSVNDNLDNNSQIEQEANTILNWSENNPFGNPTR